MNRIKKGFQKTKSHQTFKSLSERLSGHHVMTASCLTMAIAIAIAFGFGARATNPILHESAIKAASDRMEAQLHGYNVSDTVTSTRSNPIAKLSKEPIFSTPKGIAEGNKVIAQASVSSGGGAVYDAEKRIVKIVETRAGIVTSTKQFVWAGNQLCEERDASGAVTRRFFNLGEQIGGTNYYYTRDHNDSVREMTNGAGAVQSQYGYGPWGEVSKLAGSGPDSDMQYAGMYMHQPSGLNLAVNRAYSASQGRWISRDPIDDPTFSITPSGPEPGDPGARLMDAGFGQVQAMAAPNPNMMTIQMVSRDPMVQAQLAGVMQSAPKAARRGGLPQANPYTYVANNPISTRDPSGLGSSGGNPIINFAQCIAWCYSGGGDDASRLGCLAWCALKFPNYTEPCPFSFPNRPPFVK
jgi:RHS repeat-associated protein